MEEVNELTLLIEIGYVAERLRIVKMNKHGRMVLVINFQLIYLNKSKIQLDPHDKLLTVETLKT